MAGKLQQEVKNVVRRSVGTTFFVSKTVLATNVLTTATDLTTKATGKLAIKNIYLETDSTGLNSTGNAFTITVSGNTYGSATVVSQVTSGLGASVSLSFAGSTTLTTYKQMVLDAAAKLQFQVASAAATGAGYIRITVEFVRVDENAYCYSA